MNCSAPLSVALCKRTSRTGAFEQRRHWEWCLSFFLYIFINLFKTSYIGDVPVGEHATPTDVVVFFYKITENKKN
jgi:hypothetical protein